MIALDVPAPVQALNGGLFVSPGFGTHAVRIIDSWELIFVTQGRLDLFEGDAEYRVQTGQTLLLRPGIRHGGLAPYTSDVNFYWAHFRLRDAQPGGRGRVRPLSVPKLATARDPEGLTELFCRFISDQESGILDACSADQLMALMLCSVGDDTRGGGARPARIARPDLRAGRAQLVEAVHRYIDAEYRRPISTSVIAAALRYNPDYLERVFFAREGLSIVDAIHRKRIGMARAALRHDVRRNINEIGFECGYADPGYFRRIFKRVTGLTPREFRSLYARTHINTH
jgi:methylphosphotriester-DNA--protein-cysteine methyltransferase